MSDENLIIFDPEKKASNKDPVEASAKPAPAPKIMCNEGPGQAVPSLYQMRASVISPQAPPQMVLVEYMNVRPKYDKTKPACGRFIWAGADYPSTKVCGNCKHAVPDK